MSFKFENKGIRVVIIHDEEWWVARDVAAALEFKNDANAIKYHCRGGEKYYPLETAGGLQNVRIISEDDVWRLITHSKLPVAKRYEKWIFEEVLPQIRKTGGYGKTNSALEAENSALRKLVKRYETLTILTMDDKARAYLDVLPRLHA
jgi:prophage antirepressor-like protein